VGTDYINTCNTNLVKGPRVRLIKLETVEVSVVMDVATGWLSVASTSLNNRGWAGSGGPLNVKKPPDPVSTKNTYCTFNS
jgi:hypothetical protein